MIPIRAVFAGLVAVMLVGSLPAAAAETRAYSPEALAEANEAGKPVLVEVYAAWCSVCRTQSPIVQALTGEPKYKDLVVFKADFDKDKADLKALNVRQQSTLILYKDGEEIGRSVGDTSAFSIEAMLDKTL